jgi:P-type conjugative transfer protein TrbG
MPLLLTVLVLTSPFLQTGSGSATPQPTVPSVVPGTSASDPNGLTSDDPEPYFSKRQLPLTPEEEWGLRIVRDWRSTSPNDSSFPLRGPTGEVIYVFGYTVPSIVTAPLNVTDIALEPGEILRSLDIGDKARWEINNVESGGEATSRIHLIVKPHDVGLETSLVVNTDRRTYYLLLKSLRDRFMERVSFLYPDTVALKRRKLEELKALLASKERDEARQAAAEEARLRRRPRDAQYLIRGRAPWKPLLVWNDGEKTYLQMPREAQETPSLFLLRGGGLFSRPEHVMVNYRIAGDTFIVDSVIDKALLVLGGKAPQEVMILHHPKHS